MDVNQQSGQIAIPLIAWSSMQAIQCKYPTVLYSLNSIIQSGAFSLILKDIDPDYFQELATGDAYGHGNEYSLAQLCQFVEQFMVKQFGKRIRVACRNAILVEESVQELVKLLLYCCLHSKRKQEYISRILKLEQSLQTSLMNVLQNVSKNLNNVTDHNELILRVEQLQNQAQLLKSQLALANLRQQNCQSQIQQLEQDLKKKTNQLLNLKSQKQKVIEAFQLPNFEDYLSSFQRLQQQNRILNAYVNQLQESNSQFQQNEKILKRSIENQSSVIVDLNDLITVLKQKNCSLKMENYSRTSFETNDRNRRSFGKQISISDKENNCDKTRKRSFSTHKAQDENKTRQQLQLDKQQESRQLRSHNAQLIQRLDTVYKAHNSLTQQASQIKQRNQTLQKQNRFYRKQISSLRKIQDRMEKDLLAGLI